MDMLVNPTSGETATFQLPPQNWRGIGNPPGARGWRYSDRDQSEEPCRRVVLKPGRSLEAACRGAGITFTLDEPAQGSLGLTLATGAAQHFMLFGGRVVHDRPGLFLAKDAPAPASRPSAA